MTGGQPWTDKAVAESGGSATSRENDVAGNSIFVVTTIGLELLKSPIACSSLEGERF